MSSGEVQLSAFPDLVPDRELGPSPQVVPADVSLASPEWVLVAVRSGPRGWHLIKGVGTYSTLATLCGLRGAKLSSDSPTIVRCPSCEALAQS